MSVGKASNPIGCTRNTRARTLRLALVISAGAAIPLLAHGDMPPGRALFRGYGAEQGLGSLAIEELAQDSIGFLWVATQDGLYRFDGSQFTRFGEDEGLPSSSITSLLADDSGRLWVGTFAGLGWSEAGRFAAATDSSLPASPVNGLAMGARGVLWVALPQGLYEREPNGVFRRAPGSPAEEATAVWADPRGETIYAAFGSSIGRRERPGSWSFWDTGFASGERIDALVVDGEGRLWTSSLRHLISLNPAESIFRDESVHVAPSSNAPTKSVLALDRSGDLWVPTGEGLFRSHGGEWTRLGESQGLPHDWAHGVFHDREGSLWVWQGGVGLYRMLGNRMWDSWTPEDGLPAYIVFCILRDRAGRLWVGTGQGLVRASPTGWLPVEGTDSVTVRGIAEAPDGTLWLATFPTQVLQLDPRTGRLRHFGAGEGVHGRKILDLIVDDSGSVWVATVGGGLLHRPPGGPRFESVQLPVDPNRLMLSFVLEDSQRRIWTGGIGGLAVRLDATWRRFTRAEGLLSDDVALMTERRPGEFWIAYTEPIGISRILIEGGTLRVVEHLRSDSGLTSARPYFLGTSRTGALWLGTGRGIDVISKGEISHFDSTNGLVGDDCSYGAFWSDADGDVFVGTSSGLSRLRGTEALRPRHPPDTIIVRAALGGEPVTLESSGPRAFPRSRNSLGVHFTTLSFINENRTAYQVRMVGLDPAWRESNDRDALYPSLPPGSYRFEARARVGHGEWGRPGALEFTISPTWWQTPLARTSIWFLVAVAILAGYKLRVRLLNRRQELLQAVVGERTAELRYLNERLNEANEGLRRLSTTDGLTGLANRRAFDAALDFEWRRACRGSIGLALVLVDVDYFKGYNDTYGHGAGDRCLVQVAEALRAVGQRPGDLAARYGGEEFALLLPGTSVDGAVHLAEDVRRRVHELALPHATSEIANEVTVSLGVAATIPNMGEGSEALLTLADVALYRAKQNGRDRVEVSKWWGADPKQTTDSSDSATATSQG